MSNRSPRLSRSQKADPRVGQCLETFYSKSGPVPVSHVGKTISVRIDCGEFLVIERSFSATSADGPVDPHHYPEEPIEGKRYSLYGKFVKNQGLGGQEAGKA